MPKRRRQGKGLCREQSNHGEEGCGVCGFDLSAPCGGRLFGRAGKITITPIPTFKQVCYVVAHLVPSFGLRWDCCAEARVTRRRPCQSLVLTSVARSSIQSPKINAKHAAGWNCVPLLHLRRNRCGYFSVFPPNAIMGFNPAPCSSSRRGMIKT